MVGPEGMIVSMCRLTGGTPPLQRAATGFKRLALFACVRCQGGPTHLSLMADTALCVYVYTDEYCVVQRYNGSYAAYTHLDKCHVAYNDTPTSSGVVWFDAVSRSVCVCTSWRGTSRLNWHRV